MGVLVNTPPLTKDHYTSAQLLAQWIERQVPTFVGNVPAKYTEELLALLFKLLVPLETIRAAFAVLAARKVTFDYSPKYPWEFDPSKFQLNPSNRSSERNPPARMSGLSSRQAAEMQKHTFEQYEFRYNLAIRTNNHNEAEAIWRAVLELIAGILKGHGTAMQAGRNEKVQEWEEINADIDRAMERAHTLRNHVRHIPRDELARMRNMPGPHTLQQTIDGIAGRLRMTTNPDTRRGRK